MSDSRPKVVVEPIGPREQWWAKCEERDCNWRQAPDEKTYVKNQASRHRQYHRGRVSRG